MRRLILLLGFWSVYLVLNFGRSLMVFIATSEGESFFISFGTIQYKEAPRRCTHGSGRMSFRNQGVTKTTQININSDIANLYAGHWKLLTVLVLSASDLSKVLKIKTKEDRSAICRGSMGFRLRPSGLPSRWNAPSLGPVPPQAGRIALRIGQ